MTYPSTYSVRCSTSWKKPQRRNESGEAGSSSTMASTPSGWSAGMRTLPAGKRSRRRSSVQPALSGAPAADHGSASAPARPTRPSKGCAASFTPVSRHASTSISRGASSRSISRPCSSSRSITSRQAGPSQ